VAAHLPAGSPYLSTAERLVSLEIGETKAISLTVQARNARIVGTLWDPRNQDVVEGVGGVVSAWSGESWSAAPIHEGNGAYRLDVAGGLWHLNFRIDHRRLCQAGRAVNIPVAGRQTVPQPLPVLQSDGLISGTTLAPDGMPLAGALVLAHGVGKAWATCGWILGVARMAASAWTYRGSYRLGATINQPGWIKAAEKLVVVPPGGLPPATCCNSGCRISPSRAP